MHWLARLAIIVGANALALWLADRYVQGFVLNSSLEQLIVIALILAILNFILGPILKLIFGPIIVLTLGLGLIIVNAIILYLLGYIANHLDFLAGSISIQTIPALALAAIIVGVLNFIVHLAM